MFLLLAGLLVLAALLYVCVLTCAPHLLAGRRRLDWHGKNVLITGGAHGLGLELAHRLLVLGAHVVVWDVSVAHLASLEGELAAAARCVDVSDASAVQRASEALHESLRDRGGSEHVDVLVNNAATVLGRSLLTLVPGDVEALMRTNALAPLWTVQQCLPAMLASDQGGHIVTIASVAGFQGVSHLLPYTMSKFALWGFADCLRHELWALGAEDKVHTTAVFPYLIDTGMFDGVTVPWAAKWITGTGQLRCADVAQRVIDAIERREKNVIIPAHLRLLHLMRFLPTGLMDWMSRFIGAAGAMRSFSKRE